ncbi:MAG: Glu/Leu/Phe/Val dehydrogenase, partial [Microgenomates group bacterium]
MQVSDPFTNAITFLDEISSLLSKESKPYLSRLKTPNKVHSDMLQVSMDDGKTKKFQAYRSQHNDALGPYKGGIRFHQNVSESEVKALSLWMSLKCSVAGLPLGGGKGGIIVDPKKLSAKELEALSRAYARFLAPHIGPRVDVPAPDVNTNGQIMAWMLDEYEKVVGHLEPGTFTGKPLILGGSMGRDKATGFGGVLALRFLIEQLKLNDSSDHSAWYMKPISQITIAVQGFGNVGYFFAKIASEMGFRVVAVSDSKGATYIEAGLDPVATLECKQEKGSLAGCYCKGGVCDIKNGKLMSNEDMLKLPVDVLVPSALENAINGDNVKGVKAAVIIEMANGPITPEADEELNKRNILV